MKIDNNINPHPLKCGIGWPWVSDMHTYLMSYQSSKLGQFPSISLVTPSYNQGTFIEETLRSVLLQNYPNIEYIIRDGGSTDDSLSIIDYYSTFIDKQVSMPDDGQAAAINEGWKQSSGELLGWLNSDDVLSPGALLRVGEAALHHPNKVLFYGDCTIIDEHSSEIETKCLRGYDAEALLEGKSLAQPSVFIRREVVERIGFLDPSLTYALDWSYFLKALWSYPYSRIHYIPAVLSCSREYEDTKTRIGLEQKGKERRQTLREFRDNGLIPKNNRMWRRAVSGTYWMQGTDAFLEGRYPLSLKSALLAIAYSPLSLLDKITKLKWLAQENRFRDKQTKRKDKGFFR